jgi:D-alanyl-D-alanine carboxypeptidase
MRKAERGLGEDLGMMDVLRTVLFAFCALLLFPGSIESADAKARAKRQPVNKYAALVVHADSGDVLFARYADEKRYPASLTKMMTLYLLFEEIEAGRLALDSSLTVTALAAGQPPSRLGLDDGSTIDVETAIKALIVQSANDVAVVVAEAIAGSEWRFATKMTEKARALGMASTTFRNASGLPNSRQTTTARDLATLGRRLVQDFPQYYAYFATESFVWNGRTYRTHNNVVQNYPGAEGLKTGYTRRSGFNLATTASRDGARLVGVVLGGRSVRSRDSHMKELLDGAFAAIAADPALIASLHSRTPSPRIKPTLLAQLERERAVPTVGGDDAVRNEIMTAAAEFSAPKSGAASDEIGALIAAATPDELNEMERARLAALSPVEGFLGEGDVEAAAGWSVQIGAYSTKEMAQRELEEAAAAADLKAQARAIEPMRSNAGNELYRARFVNLSAEDAASVCAGLLERDVSCFVVQDGE